MSIDYNEVCSVGGAPRGNAGQKQLTRFGIEQTDLDIKEALAKGYEVVQGGPQDLLLDLDTEADLKYSQEQSAVLRRVLPQLAVWDVEVWRSRSGNYHAQLKFPSGVYLDVLEHLLLEVCLGGDRKRALFSYARLRNGVDPLKCSLLWKPKVGVTAIEEVRLNATSVEPAPLVPEELLERAPRRVTSEPFIASL